MRATASRALACLALAAAVTACDDDVVGTDPTAESEPSAMLVPIEGSTDTGYMIGRYGQPREVRYEVVNGWAIVEGDIIIGKAGEVPRTEQELIERLKRRGVYVPGLHGSFILGQIFRWPGGVVPIHVAAALPDKDRVWDAIDIVEQATTGVEFVLLSEQAAFDFVGVVDGDVCSSSVGRQGGPQFIILGPDCSTGAMVHELLHALGMYHEQSRCDRDNFVEIIWDNIEDGKEHNFEKHCLPTAFDIADYSEESIMHYSPMAFSKNDEPTIVSKRNRDHLMGQTSGLSDTDAFTINFLYGAFNEPPTAVIGPLETSYPEGSEVSFDGSGSSDPDPDTTLLFSWDFGDGTCDVAEPPAECFEESPTHTYVDDGIYTVKLTVSDGPWGEPPFLEDETTATVTVENVAPTVSVSVNQDFEVNEGSTLLIRGRFGDPGLEDQPFTAEIQCYDVNGHELTLEGNVVGVQEGVGNSTGILVGDALAHCPYGDTSEPGTFWVTVTVTDKDGGVGEISFEITARSRNPTVNLEMDGAVDVNGVPTFMAQVGEPVDFTAHSTDPGSDDLTLTWDWGDGTMDVATYLLGADPDPFPSPTMDPRDVTDERSHAWTGACFFELTLTAQDDDGGERSTSANVLIMGLSGRARGAGYWQTQYRGKRSKDFDEAELGCLLHIGGYMSNVFDELRPGTATFEDAAAVLHTGGSGNDRTAELDQQLLAAWLDPDVTDEELEAQKDILEAINLMHGG